jgi:hypothetical protein
VADDWRVTVAFADAIDAHAAVQGLRKHQAGGLAPSARDGVAVSVDGPDLFLYAATEDVARAAERVVREVLAQYQLVTAGVRLDRWHPDEQDWEDEAVRMPGSEEERAAERQRLMDDQTQQSAAAGQAGWLVRVNLPSRGQAIELAERLRAQGRPVARRWKYLILGAANEDEAEALAEAVTAQSPADTTVQTQANPNVTGFGRPGSGGAEYLALFLT